MFIDTHCHLTDEYAAPDDLAAIITRAADANVDTLICPSADPLDIQKAIDLTKQFDRVFCTVGIHPEFAKANIDVNVFLPDSIFTNEKILGIGEIGLDYHYGTKDKNQQIELFEKQIVIAQKHNLPVAVHTREAETDTIAILNSDIRGVMHCFTSSWDMARVMLDRGFYFSASGILTFKNADELRETFSKIPTDRIVIETDSPYCAPMPYRGKKCEPFMTVETAKALAQIKNLHLNDLEIILMQNTRNLYPKIKL